MNGRFRTLGAGLLAGALLLAACSTGEDPGADGGAQTDAADDSGSEDEDTGSSEDEAGGTDGPQGEIVIAVAEELPTLQSVEGYQASRGMPLRNIQEPLVFRDPETNDLAPGLATSWERTTDTTWTFQIREGVQFHDGSPLNAEAVATGINFTYQPDSGFTINEIIGSPITAEAVGEFTVEISTEEPDPILPGRMWQALIPSAVQLEEAPDDYLNTPIGTGPYKFVEWNRGESYVVEANTDWWGIDNPEGLGEVNFERATFLIRPDANSRISAVRAGDADFAWELPGDACQADLGDNCISGPAPAVVFFRLDTVNPVLADVRIREAIDLALDRAGIGEALLGGAPPAAQMVTESAVGHNPDLEVTSYDPEAARELVDAAKADGVPVDETELQMIGRAGNFAGVSQVTEAMINQLQEVGLNISGGALEEAQWREAFTLDPVPPERGALVSAQHNNDNFDFQRTYDTFYRCGGRGGGCYEEIDAMADEVQELTGEERDQAWQEINAAVNSDYSVFQEVPVTEGLKFYGVADTISWTPRLDTQFLLKDVSRN